MPCGALYIPEPDIGQGAMRTGPLHGNHANPSDGTLDSDSRLPSRNGLRPARGAGLLVNTSAGSESRRRPCNLDEVAQDRAYLGRISDERDELHLRSTSLTFAISLAHAERQSRCGTVSVQAGAG